MVNSFENLVDLIVSLFFFFLVPVMYYEGQQDFLVQNIIEQETTDFVETITTKGYLSKQMYESFEEALIDLMPNIDIELEHNAKVYLPEYTFEEEPVFSGRVSEIYSVNISAEIKEEIFHESGIYHFNTGDHFSVTIKNKNMSKAAILIKKITTYLPVQDILVDYGKTVRGG